MPHHGSTVLLLILEKTLVQLMSVMKRGKSGKIFMQTQVLCRDSSFIPQQTGLGRVNTLVKTTLLQIYKLQPH